MDTRDINELYAPEHFRDAGHELIELLTEYLKAGLQGHEKVLSWRSPQQEFTRWQASVPRQGTLTSQELLHTIRDEVLATSLRVHHPRNLGHQVAPPLPIAALCDLVAALTNQAMAVYETGPSATMIERQVISWLAELIGWPDAEGVLTSGGAQANLTALLAARQCKAGWDVWKHGTRVDSRLRLMASEHAHYSVSRAAGIMGLGTEAVIPVATDARGRMDMLALSAAWSDCIARGEQPFVVVATAGCTPTGSIDPLDEIGAFCREHDIWFHVDGAHGASSLLTTEYRSALQGVALADSVVWDGHKLLYMPAAVSAVLFRDPRNSYAAFAQEASYLFHGNTVEDESFNTSYRTLECTKRMMGLKLWAAFSMYGVDKLGELVTHVFQSARQLAEKIEATADFELLMPPQTNIVCFRYLPVPEMSLDALNAAQAALRWELVQSGAFHLTQTTVHGIIWLRATVMNPLTTEEDLDELISGMRAIGSH
ncbi:L-2,4-diaminobutyrate decarboxylase [mine drainage metagenome]|uniref:L-2,4-diaminobutyrate decarboxylase n=1 Tax=mine drainage metagenome TaxID=410659 RepID=A0A1J5PQR7_9ZZZZ